MFIKNVTAYKLSEMPEDRLLDEGLGNCWFTPPGGLDWFSEGFTVPSPFADTAAVVAGDTLKICLMREEKILSSGAIKKVVDDKVAKIMAEEARTVGRIEKMEIKEAVIDDLLPRALTRRRRTFAIFTGGWLLVDAAAAKQAENLLSKLREAMNISIGAPLNTWRSPASLMTDWLIKGKADGDFELGRSVTLQGVGDVAPLVKISKKDLSGTDVIQHAINGLKVTEMELIWKERIVFTLTDQLTLKRIRYLDVLTEAAKNGADDTAAAEFAAQVICADALSQILNELTTICGGLID